MEEVRNNIRNIIKNVEEQGNVECEEEIEEALKLSGIEKFEVSIDDMFDSPGYDVYSVSVAWIENGIINLTVGSICIS